MSDNNKEKTDYNLNNIVRLTDMEIAMIHNALNYYEFFIKHYNPSLISIFELAVKKIDEKYKKGFLC